MDDIEIISLIIFSFLLLAGIVLVIVLVKRNNKYKDFVLLNSLALKNLKTLNSKTKFFDVKSKFDLYHRFDNKTSYTKTECYDFLIRDIRTNYIQWYELSKQIQFNITKEREYLNNVKDAYAPIDSSICLSSKKKYSKCMEIEKNMFDSLVIHPKTSITISVTLQYISPKGRVNILKHDSFNYANLQRMLSSVSKARMDKETYERFVRAERGVLSDSMRYDVLKRDNFRCVICGLSAKDGVVLHVDHIIPVSKGGRTVMSNLRTLCERCNLGKSNKIE